ncbi:MAG: methyltransferase [Acidobacteriota bacterium]|nr:methyltransferase [Acidobacteriota bacterium]MDH3522852.1 methyltransferase [Acidobacteriota bacterium]
MNGSASVHLQAFLKDPKGVAALLPTAAPVVQRIASKVEPDSAGLIVEYGPGSGVLTRRLLERLGRDGRLLAIERNADFAARLGDTLADPRLIVVRESAQSVRDILRRLDLPQADCVLSGIPFFWLPPETALEIVTKTHGALKDGGRFVTYQVFYQSRRRLRVHLEKCFSEVRSEVDLRNLPPYRICEAIK